MGNTMDTRTCRKYIGARYMVVYMTRQLLCNAEATECWLVRNIRCVLRFPGTKQIRQSLLCLWHTAADVWSLMSIYALQVLDFRCQLGKMTIKKPYLREVLFQDNSKYGYFLRLHAKWKSVCWANWYKLHWYLHHNFINFLLQNVGHFLQESNP